MNNVFLIITNKTTTIDMIIVVLEDISNKMSVHIILSWYKISGTCLTFKNLKGSTIFNNIRRTVNTPGGASRQAFKMLYLLSTYILG